MFTLLPSLYLVAVHYIRQWKTPYYYEQNGEEEKCPSHPQSIADQTVSIEEVKQSKTTVPLLPQPDQSSSSSPDQISLTRSESNETNGYISSNVNSNDEESSSHPVKLRAKRLSRSSSSLNVDRRKTYTGDLSESDIIYLMNETGFTREQILLWHSDFLVSLTFHWPTEMIVAVVFLPQRDCPDGKLSKYKFIDIYKQFYTKGQVAKFCEHAFRVFDKDGSGYIGTLS